MAVNAWWPRTTIAAVAVNMLRDERLADVRHHEHGGLETTGQLFIDDVIQMLGGDVEAYRIDLLCR